MDSMWKWAPVLAAAGAAGVGGLMRSRYERDHFVVEETVIHSPKIRTPHTLAFLTDLHDKEFGPRNRRLIEAVRRVRPDAVLIGGDTMVVKEGKARLEVTERLLEGLAGINRGADAGGAGARPCTIYYADGNHEQRMRWEKERFGDLNERFCRMLAERDIHYLRDCSEFLGDDLCISGLEIDLPYYRNLRPDKMEASYISRHLGDADRERFHILLAHSPVFFDAYARWGADLVLAGHFHGGTIRIPGLGGLMTPQYQFFYPWCAGTFEKEGSHMIVGRGLGTHSVNIRIHNKPQVVVVRLKPAATF